MPQRMKQKKNPTRRVSKGKYYHLNQDQDDADTQKADLLAP